MTQEKSVSFINYLTLPVLCDNIGKERGDRMAQISSARADRFLPRVTDEIRLMTREDHEEAEELNDFWRYEASEYNDLIGYADFEDYSQEEIRRGISEYELY